jgi:hypothetical protein
MVVESKMLWCNTSSAKLDTMGQFLHLTPFRYMEKDPSTFKTGDLVEMGFAFVAWKKPGRNVGPEWCCMLVLRTLTFLDGCFMKVSLPAVACNL